MIPRNTPSAVFVGFWTGIAAPRAGRGAEPRDVARGAHHLRVALLNREKLGLSVLVFSHVKLAGHGREALLRFEQAVRAHPEILECYTLMGETDFLLRIACRDIKACEAFFLDHLSRFPGVQSVNSSIALAVIKETTALPSRL